MNTITVIGYLLMLVGLYASFRGLTIITPISKRNGALDVMSMLVGVVGFYEFTLGFFFIIVQ